MELTDHLRLKVFSSRRPLLVIETKLGKRHGLGSGSIYRISFGTHSTKARLRLDKSQPASVLAVSEHTQGELVLSAAPAYLLRRIGKEIRLGPLIGILYCRRRDRLTSRRLRRLQSYIREYPRLRCSIVVFSLDQINRRKLTVNGFLYNPTSDSWDAGTYPFPAAMYRRIGVPPSWRDFFHQTIGRAWFNDYYWDKFELHQRLSTLPAIRDYLPETRLALTVEDVQCLLAKHGRVFLKPVAGMRGRGAVQLAQSGAGVSVRRADMAGSMLLARQEEVTRFLLEQVIGTGYLVQQYLPLLKWQDCVIDLRVLMQKEDDCRWHCQGMVVRQGMQGSIVSNISRRGVAWQVDLFLRDCLSLTEQAAQEWRQQAEQVAGRVCAAIDTLGWNNGTIGLDLGLDQSGRWWLIEANNRDPDPTIALDANDSQLYRRLKLAPLLYAKGLAGFGPDHE